MTLNPKLQQYIDFLTAANERINLVSRKDIANVVEHHVQPSLYYLELERIQPGDTILDIGSGGGFPGLVIAIMQPETEVTLVDSIMKKAHFLQEAATTLALKNVNVLNARVEQLAKQANYKHRFDHVTARAVAPLNQLWDWAEPLLTSGGSLEAMKGLAAAEAEVTYLLNVDYDLIRYPETNTVIVSVHN